jgi:hypothetical protein
MNDILLIIGFISGGTGIIILLLLIIGGALSRIEKLSIKVANLVVLLQKAADSELCGATVSWDATTDATCVRPYAHKGDCAVTLASIEKIGYVQPPF